MLVFIAITVFVLTVIMNVVVMVKYADEQDKNQAWLPKLVVVRLRFERPLCIFPTATSMFVRSWWGFASRASASCCSRWMLRTEPRHSPTLS
jgi:hypothetical protein